MRLLPIGIMIALNLFLTTQKPNIELTNTNGDIKHLEDVSIIADSNSGSLYKSQRVIMQNGEIFNKEYNSPVIPSYVYNKEHLKEKLDEEDYDLIDTLLSNKDFLGYSFSTNSNEDFTFVNFLNNKLETTNLNILRKDKSNGEIKEYKVNLDYDFNGSYWITNISSNFYNDKLYFLCQADDDYRNNNLLGFEIDLENNKSKLIFQKNTNEKNNEISGDRILYDNFYSDDKLYFITQNNEADYEEKYKILEYDINKNDISYTNLSSLINEQSNLNYEQLYSSIMDFTRKNNEECILVADHIQNKKINFVVSSINFKNKTVDAKNLSIETDKLDYLSDVLVIDNKLYITLSENKVDKIYIYDINNGEKLFESIIKSNVDVNFNILENKKID